MKWPSFKKLAEEKGKSSFGFAYYLDTCKEERERGVTIQCNTKEFFTEKYHYTIVDAPGHKDYIKNMITGSATADVGLLLVPAEKGGFEAAIAKADPKLGVEEGQTRQHARLLVLSWCRPDYCWRQQDGLVRLVRRSFQRNQGRIRQDASNDWFQAKEGSLHPLLWIPRRQPCHKDRKPQGSLVQGMDGQQNSQGGCRRIHSCSMPSTTLLFLPRDTPMLLFVFLFPTFTTSRVLDRLSAVPSNRELFVRVMSLELLLPDSRIRRFSPLNSTRRFSPSAGPGNSVGTLHQGYCQGRKGLSLEISSTSKRKVISSLSRPLRPWLPSRNILVSSRLDTVPSFSLVPPRLLAR